MPSYPSIKDDTVLYEPKSIYSDKNIKLSMLDDSILEIWGNAYYNGAPLNTVFTFDVKAYGAKGDGVADDTVAVQAAVNAAIGGGVVTFPRGTYKVSSTIVVPNNYTILQGIGSRLSVISYTGTGIALSVTAFQKVRIVSLGVENTGTGTVGIILGQSGAALTFGFTVDDVDIRNFSLYGLQVASCEQLLCSKVFAYRNGNGFRVEHIGSGPAGMENRFVVCRAEESVNEGWYVDKQIAATFTNCESLNSGPSGSPVQFRTGFSTYLLHIDRLDVERTGGSFPSAGVGLRLAGEYHKASIQGFGLDVGIDVITASKGMYIDQCRWGGTITTAHVRIGAAATETTVYDPGNITVVNSAPLTEIAYVSLYGVGTNNAGTTLGFYGATPVVKAASPGVAAGSDAAVINAVVTALRNLGLVT